MARLVLTTAEGQQVVDLRPVNSLGRHPSNSIQLLDKIVSKEHCIIEQRGPAFVLRDLGSLNGTFVNGERVIGEAPLRNGDEIALGSTRARFEEAGRPVASDYPPAQVGPAPTSALPQQQPWMQPAPSTVPADPAMRAWQARQQQQGGPQPQPMQPMPQPSYGPQPGYVRQPTPGGQYSAVPQPQMGGYPPMQQPGQQPAYNRMQGPPPVPPGGPMPPAAQPGQGSVAPVPPQRRPPPPRTPARGFSTAYIPHVAQTTHVDQDNEARQIGAQIAAVEKEFLQYEELAKGDPAQLRADYERLRLSYELSRDIATERDTSKLLEKILLSVFRFIPAQRGVIFLRDETGELTPGASYRRDGSTSAISVSTTILKKVVEERTAVLTHDAAMDFAASKGKSMILNRIQSAIVAPMLHKEEVLGVLWLDSQTLAQFQPKDLQLVTGVANQAAMFIEINILGKQVEAEIVKRERLGRFLSPNVRERVVSGELEVELGGARCEVTVFNSDIRGFTSMSEHTPPEDIVEMLNTYFDDMVSVIYKREGTLDKFMGDGIMAFWGAPVAHTDDPERSVECALEQTEVLGRFNRDRMARDQAPLGVGIGIHTGPCVVGNIGSSETLGYTVIGDVANTSARLCSLALAGQIVVSESTFLKLGPRFVCDELAPAKVKGKNKPIRLFNVIRMAPVSQVPVSVEPTTEQQARGVAE
ncbi:MAG: FHA domain-containing protein [Polyangiaceae bacterium]|nr:FHA domain-containing protein [Polyangiaceae bacterium]